MKIKLKSLIGFVVLFSLSVSAISLNQNGILQENQRDVGHSVQREEDTINSPINEYELPLSADDHGTFTKSGPSEYFTSDPLSPAGDWLYDELLEGGENEFQREVTYDDSNDALDMKGRMTVDVKFGNVDYWEFLTGGFDWTLFLDALEPNFNGGDCLAEWDVNLMDVDGLGNSLRNAQVNVTWGFLTENTGSFVEFQASIDGGEWTLIEDSRVDNDFYGDYSFSLKELCLTGEETSVKLRIRGSLRPTIGITTNVKIYSIKIQTFESNIEDNAVSGVINDLDDNLIVTQEMFRCGTDSGLDFTAAYYKLYYSINNPTVDDTDSFVNPVITTDLDNNDHATLVYTVPISSNCTVYYQLWVGDYDIWTLPRTLYYKSEVYSVTMYDGFAPVFDGTLQYSATNSTLEAGDDFHIIGSIIDTGGGGLLKAICYWSDTSAVSLTNYQDYQTITLYGNTDSFNFNIDSSEFVMLEPKYFRIYVYDNSYHEIVSNLVQITSNDYSAPDITPLGSTPNNVGYDVDKSLQFNIYEPTEASGVKTTSVKCYYNINLNQKGTAHLLPVTSRSGDVWNYVIGTGNYSFADKIYIWMDASDNLDNIQSKQYILDVIDLNEPLLEIDHTNSNFTDANIEENLKITVETEDVEFGSGFQQVALIFMFDHSFTWSEEYPIRTPVQISEKKFEFFIYEEQLREGELYYIIRSYDQSGNFAQISGHFPVVNPNPESPTTTDQNSQTDTTNTDGPAPGDPTNLHPAVKTTLIVGGAVAGVVGLGVGTRFAVKKIKEKRYNATFLDSWERGYQR